MGVCAVENQPNLATGWIELTEYWKGQESPVISEFRAGGLRSPDGRHMGAGADFGMVWGK